MLPYGNILSQGFLFYLEIFVAIWQHTASNTHKYLPYSFLAMFVSKDCDHRCGAGDVESEPGRFLLEPEPEPLKNALLGLQPQSKLTPKNPKHASSVRSFKTRSTVTGTSTNTG